MARSSSRISCTVVLFGPLSASTIAWLALVRVGIRPRWDMPSMTASSALRRTPRGFRYLYETLMLSPFPILLSSPEYCPPLKVYRCPADKAGNPSFEMKDPLPSGFSLPHQRSEEQTYE